MKTIEPILSPHDATLARNRSFGAFFQVFVQPEISIKTRVILFLSTWLLLFLFYFWKLGPILDWIHSDNAVPYIMANSPFSWGDMFTWPTRRLGIPYSFCWKLVHLATGRTIPPELFYYVYIAIVLLGISSVWLFPLPPLLNTVLILFLCPMTTLGVHHLFDVSQPYGMLIGYLFLILYGVLKKRAFPLCIGIFFLFLQFPPIGALGVAIGLGSVWLDWSVWKEKAKSLLLFSVGEFLIYHWLKSHAVKDDGFHWLSLPPSRQIIPSLKKVFFEFGLSFDSQGGILGLFLLACILWAGFVMIFQQKNRHGYYWGGLLLGWCLGSMLFIAFNNWFFINLRDLRYFNAVTLGALTLMLFAICTRLTDWKALLVPLAFVIVLKQMPLLHGRDSYPSTSGERIVKIAQEARSLGCKGLVGTNHWDTYFIGAVTGMEIVGTTYPSSINLNYSKRAISKMPLCLVDSEGPRVDTWLSARLHLNCVSGNQEQIVKKCSSVQ